MCIKIDGQCTCAKCTTLLTVFWNGKLSSTKFLCRLGDDENFENCRNGHTCDLADVVTMFLWGRIGWDQLLYVPLGCLLYSCIHSCVSRFKRIYATFRGDEWINKRIINRKFNFIHQNSICLLLEQC